MKKNGQTTLLGTLFLLLCLIFFSCQKKNEENMIPVENNDELRFTEIDSPSPAKPPHRLSIDGMRSTDYSITPFTTVKGIHDNDIYSSRDVSYVVNGLKEYALISMPKAPLPEEGFPVILLLHGYIPPTRYSTVNSYPIVFDRYARAGFIVVKPDYRGHGRSERNEDFQRSLSALYYTEDVRQLIASLETVEEADMKNVFLMGHSLGGEVALRLLTVFNEIRGASLWAPMTVKREEANFFYGPGGGKRKYGDDALSVPEAQEELKVSGEDLDEGLKIEGISGRDAIRFQSRLKDIKTPMIIRHPDADQSVPYQWSIDFKKLYDASGNPLDIEIINYPGDNHNIDRNQAKAQAADVVWFRSLMETTQPQ